MHRVVLFLSASNKCADQTARIRRLVCAFVVCMHRSGFLTSIAHHLPIYASFYGTKVVSVDPDRSHAAKHGFGSGSPLFAYRMFQNLNKIKHTHTQQPLIWK